MKRDIDLIKLLLSNMEQETEETTTKIDKYQDEEEKYNLYLLVNGGFVDGKVIANEDGSIGTVIVKKMTWNGHELLDALNNESALEKMKDAIKDGLSLGAFIDASKEIGMAFLKKKLGLEE